MFAKELVLFLGLLSLQSRHKRQQALLNGVLTSQFVVTI
jgi:hypothetical protein